ncbi:MAG: DUF1552 domain-containing protein [Verrucomicrobiota bacterium]|nr:DUF1552 domain-containing protein [Verrucomicrobiota bacterium]
MSQQADGKMSTLRAANLSRRRFLRGLGACMALPAMESVLTSALQAAGPAVASTPGGAPVRMAYVYFPNGAHQSHWWPTGEGANFEFAKTMQPLAGLKNRVQVIGGLDHIHATAGQDGAGDHARANGTFLTGVRVKKTAGGDIHAGVSIDQVVAEKVGHLTRFPSLELTCDAVRKSGNCDSGYSCAYQHNLSWRSPTVPMAPEPNPRFVFERLFGAGEIGERRKNIQMRQAQQRSILDFVLEDARSLQKQLASRDKQKLDEYLTSVRELEKQIEQAEKFKDTPDPAVQTPEGIPGNFEEHMRLMYSMMVLAFQTDSTRIATFLLAGDGNNRAFPHINIPEGHHYLSHHQNKADMMEKVAEIDLWYMKQFAWFLQKMEETKDLDGRSLLENSMIVYGCGNSDGNRHTHVNLPIVLAGGGGGLLKPGRFVKAGGVPMSNLLLSLADRMGAKGLERFGDSTGRFELI